MNVGTLAPLDVVAAESEVATREEGVVIAENQLAEAQDALRRVIFPKNDPEASLPIGVTVISGHISRDEALLTEDAIAIDVRGTLSAVLLPERAVISVPSGIRGERVDISDADFARTVDVVSERHGDELRWLAEHDKLPRTK